MRERPFGAKNSPPLVLILACERSGSTLLRAMLSAHPQLFCPPELNLLPFRSLRERTEVLDPRQCWGLNHAWMVAGGLTPEEADAALGQLTRDGISGLDVYERLMSLLKGRTLVDKSPLYSRDPAGLRRGAAYFGSRISVIHLVRHPKSVIDSLARITLEHLSKQTVSPAIEPYDTAEAGWYDSNTTILDFLKTIKPNQKFRLSYEELVEGPEQAMANTLAFLKQKYSPKVLEPYRYGEMLTSPFPGSLTGDPTFLSRSHIDPTPARMGKYLTIPLRRETRALARELGYV